MNYRRLGRSGLLVSEISFGAWTTFGNTVDLENAEACMRAAYDAGINFFDNAEAYALGKAETVMGEIIAKLGWARDTYVVSSKVFWGGDLPNQTGLSRKHVFEACHAALRRLRVDYLDLYYCHRADPNTPMEETVRAMDQLISQGKVLYWGTSEWSAQEIMEAYAVARQHGLTPPTMEQPQYNMLWRSRVEVEYAPLYERIGLGTTVWSPLAQGLLTGKYNDGVPDGSRATNPKTKHFMDSWLAGEKGERNVAIVKNVAALASKLGVSTANLALAWCLKNPHVSTAITGATRTEHVVENVKAGPAAEKLTPEIMHRIGAILEGGTR
jgi:voltage-dependent potassium channel beta subunit